MKRWVINGLLGSALVFLLLLLGGYYYLSSILPSLPEKAKVIAQKNGLSLDYSQSTKGERGLSIDLTDFVLLDPKHHQQVQIKTLNLGVALSLKFPIIKLFAHAENPTVLNYEPETKTDNRPQEETSEEPAKSEVPKLAALALVLIRAELSVNNANFPGYGVSGLSGQLNVSGIRLSPSGLSQVNLDHELTLQSYSSQPWIQNLHSSGATKYRGQKTYFENQNVQLGKIQFTANGEIDTQSLDWKANLLLPQTNLEETADFLPKLEFITHMKGILFADLLLTGHKNDPSSIRAQGKLGFQEVEFAVDHASLKGPVFLDGSFEFADTAQLIKSCHATLNLSDASIHLPQFEKPKQVPLEAKLEMESTDNSPLEIRSGWISFNNLKAEIKGKLGIQENTNSEFQVAVSPTNLNGWQKFFPQYQKLVTEGSIALDANFAGPLREWRRAVIKLNLDANQIKFPILREWLPDPALSIEGPSQINSQTSIIYSSGTIEKLSTKTKIDLGGTSIQYKNFFYKNPKTPLNLSLNVESDLKEAELKTADLTFGEAIINAKGKVRELDDPKVNLDFSSNKIDLGKFSQLFSIARQTGVDKLRGNAILKANLSGPIGLKKAAPPSLSGDLTLQNVGFNYFSVPLNHRYQLEKIDGNLKFSENSISSDDLVVNLPRTHSNLQLKFRSLTPMKGKVTWLARDFALADFYTSQDSTLIAGTLPPVPVVQRSNPETKEVANKDWRSNPYVQTADLEAAINIKQADFPWGRAQNFSTQLSFSKLQLKIDPMQLYAFGGILKNKLFWDGNPEIPQTSLELEVNGVNANEYLGSWSPKFRDILTGSLNSKVNLTMLGMDATKMKETATGNGNIQLSGGSLHTVKFSKEPLEALRRLPILQNEIKQTQWDESIQDMKGNFKIHDQKIEFSNVLIRTPIFDAETNELVVGFDQNIHSKINFTPKSTLLSNELLTALKDSSGNPNIPLGLNGNIKSPVFSVESSALANRLANYGIQKATNSIRNQLSNSEEKKKIEDKLKNAVKGLF